MVLNYYCAIIIFMGRKWDNYLWLGLRLTLGLIFLWAFFDKLFGLGFSTTASKAWINGGSPTIGFLGNAVTGPLTSFYHWLSNYSFVIDWFWMLGLLFVGVSLTFGIALRLGSYAGAVLMFLAWTALIPPTTNPVLDEHVVYIFSLLLLSSSKAAYYFGLGKWWSKFKFVKKYPVLK